MNSFMRNTSRARLMGVCAGIADGTGLDLRLVRVAVVLLTLAVAGGWGIAAYLLAGVCAPVRTS